MAVRQAVAISAVSRRQCAYFREQYDCNVEYIPTATIIPRRMAPNNILKRGLVPGRYFLFTSRLVHEKGVHTLIKAFKQIKTNMRLVIAGDCDGGEIYKHQLWDLAYGDDRIIFTGYIEGELLAELFSNAYVYVQPSTVEGLSIALLEAMSYGRCCLVSDIPENLEPLDGTGYSFRVNSVQDLGTKLRWLLENPHHVHSVGAKAMEHVRSEYSWDFVTDKMEDFYHRTLSGDISVRIKAKSAVSH
jgi:glycosyltransferase involved in cell wall biosynthesis